LHEAVEAKVFDWRGLEVEVGELKAIEGSVLRWKLGIEFIPTCTGYDS